MLKICLVLILLSIIFISISLSTNEWTTSNNNNLNYEQGLWKICGNLNIPTFKNNFKDINIGGCSEYKTISNSLKAIRVMSILSLIFLIISFIKLIYFPKYKIYAIIDLILCVILTISSCSIWSSNKDLLLDGTSLGYSWYLELISGVLLLFPIIYLIMKLND